MRSDETISVMGVGERCYRCFNEEAADRLGVAFDHSPLQSVELTDADGATRVFEIQSMLVPAGHEMIAHEVPRRKSGGYRFAVLGDVEVDALILFQRIYEKMRRELSVRHVEPTEHGWQLTDRDELVGRIEWDGDAGGATPVLVVDGKALSWDEVGRMPMTFEGFSLLARVEDGIEVVGGPLAVPIGGEPGGNV